HPQILNGCFEGAGEQVLDGFPGVSELLAENDPPAHGPLRSLPEPFDDLPDSVKDSAEGGPYLRERQRQSGQGSDKRVDCRQDKPEHAGQVPKGNKHRRPDERADWGESFPEAAESVVGTEQPFADAPYHGLTPTEPLRLGKTIHSWTEPGAQVIEHRDEAVEQVPCLGETRAENARAEPGQGSADVAKGATGRL